MHEALLVSVGQGSAELDPQLERPQRAQHLGEEGGQQVRQFEQGALRFDAARAVLTLEQPVFDGELAAVAVDAVPADLDAGVGAYLAQLD